MSKPFNMQDRKYCTCKAKDCSRNILMPKFVKLIKKIFNFKYNERPKINVTLCGEFSYCHFKTFPSVFTD